MSTFELGFNMSACKGMASSFAACFTVATHLHHKLKHIRFTLITYLNTLPNEVEAAAQLRKYSLHLVILGSKALQLSLSQLV